MKTLKICAFLGLALTLAACEDFPNTVTNTLDQLTDMGVSAPNDAVKGKPLSERLVEEGQCPIVEVMPELGSFYDLRPPKQFGAAPTYVNKAEISIAGSQCSYGPKSVTIDVRLAFSGAQGAVTDANAAPSYSYPYFVAILSPGGKILAKKVFAQTLNYGVNQKPIAYVKLRQIVPVYSQKNGASYKIVMGFQLAQPQLDYNRNIIKQKEAEQKAYLVEQNNYLRVHSPAQTGLQPMPVITKPAPGESPEDNGPLIFAPQNDTPSQDQNNN